MAWGPSRKQYNPDQEGYGNEEQWKNAFKNRMFKKKKKKKRIAELEVLYKCKTLSDLKSTYRKLVIKYHPDKAGDTVKNKEITQRIIETYNELKVKFVE
jgi:preprotein translocase subunit Sec63